MSSPRKRHVLLGLLGGSLPLVLQAACGALLVVWLGGVDGLSRTLGMAGRSIHLMGLLSLVCTVALGLVLFFLATGRNVPVVVPVVLATVPWLLGLAGALRGARGVLEAVASLPPGDRLVMLIQGTGELLCARLLGAWSSMALLLATAGALFLASVPASGASPAPGASNAGDRRLEGSVVLLLALLCALAALESKGLSQVLVDTARANPDDQATLLLRDSLPLRTPRRARPVVLAGLVVAGLALGARRLTRKPPDLAAFLTLSPLAVVAVGILWADGRPVARMSEALEQATLPPSVLSGVRLLPLGGDEDTVQVEVLATARGLARPGGGEVPWSVNDKSLIDFLREPVANLGRQEPTRDRPPPALGIAVDAGISVAELRRLIDLATQMDLTALSLVGTRVPDAQVARLSEGLAGTPPVLQQVAAALYGGSTPRVSRIVLLPMLNASTFTPGSTWVAELGAGHRLVLSKIPLGSRTLELELSGPEPEPELLVDRRTVLFLTVTEQASLEDVATAVRRSQAHGFTVLLSARPPPLTRQP